MPDIHFGDILLGAIVAVLGWIVREKIRVYDKHLENSVIRDRELLSLQEQVHHHRTEDERYFAKFDSNFESAEKERRWIGECLIRIGLKLNLELPPRPE